MDRPERLPLTVGRRGIWCTARGCLDRGDHAQPPWSVCPANLSANEQGIDHDAAGRAARTHDHLGGRPTAARLRGAIGADPSMADFPAGATEYWG